MNPELILSFRCACQFLNLLRKKRLEANGMLRRYFPKGTDFSKVTNRQLQSAVDKINV